MTTENKQLINEAARDADEARLRGRGVKEIAAEAREARAKVREISKLCPEVNDTYDFEAGAKALDDGTTKEDLKNTMANAVAHLEACNRVAAEKTEAQAFRFAANSPIVGEQDIQQVYYKGEVGENLFDRMERLHGATNLEGFDAALKGGIKQEFEIESAKFDDIRNAVMTRGGSSANPPTGILPDRGLTVEKPYEAVDKRRILLDILPKATTRNDIFKYRKEIDAGNTNAVAPKAEGALGAMQDFGTKEATAIVETFFAYGTITDEQAADVSFARPYASMILARGMSDTKENQLLNGNGTSPQIKGIIASKGLTDAKVATDTHLDFLSEALEKYEAPRDAATAGAGTSPTHLICSAAYYRKLQRSKTTDGWYLFGNPSNPVADYAWGVKIVLTDFLPANTAVFICADPRYILHVQREGVQVATGFVNDDFAKKQRSLRISSRSTLAVIRENTIQTLTALNL